MKECRECRQKKNGKGLDIFWEFFFFGDTLDTLVTLLIGMPGMLNASTDFCLHIYIYYDHTDNKKYISCNILLFYQKNQTS